MKEFFSFMMGAMFGAAVMLGASELSKNKEVIKNHSNLPKEPFLFQVR